MPTANGDTSKATSTPSAFYAPAERPNSNAKASTPAKPAPSTPAPSALKSTTSILPSAATGSTSGWNRRRKVSSRKKTSGRILDLLTRADIFEQVMQQRYLGAKRFSLEGTTALIPLVDEVLEPPLASAQSSW